MSDRRRFLGFLRPSVEADIDDELRFHLDSSVRDLEAMGLTYEEARAEALRRFGDVATVASWLRSHDHHRLRREAWVAHMDTLIKDIRLAVRKLWQQPGFSVSVVLVLALGIGAATAMFSAVDAALLRPLPFRDDGRLVVVEQVYLPFELSRGRNVLIDDARALEVFDGVAAYAPGGLNLGAGGTPIRINVGVVTPDLFAVLGVAPAAGRAFTAEEGTRAGAPVAIISDGIWRSHYGSSRDALGQDVVLNGKTYEIVGIMPPGFAFPRESAVWIPLRLPYGFADFEPFRQFMPSVNVARLAPGVTIEQAREQVLAMVRANADPGRPFTLTGSDVVMPMRDVLVASRRTALLVLMGATALVLLVACANATNLLLSRGATRRTEMALRTALGASRSRIVRLLVAESLILALAGGVVGAALAYLAVGALGAIMPPSLAGLSPASLDLRVLAFSLVASVATGVVFGIWPALGATRTDGTEIIRGGGAGATPARHGARLRRAFVVAELAISLVLAVGAGLMLRSLQTILGNDPGIVPEHVATLEMSINRETYRQAASRRVLLDGILERLDRTPGIDAIAFVNELPLRGASSVRLVVQREGTTLSENMDENAWGLIQHVSPEYFRAMGIPLLAGRMAEPALDSLAPREIVLSQSLARRLFENESPLGRRVTIAGDMHRTVVGVAGNVRARALDDSVGMQMYMPIAESPGPNVALVARGTLPTHALAGHLREAVITQDPQQAVYNVRSMEDVIASALTPWRVNTILITGFSLVALALAAVGVYGVMSFAVARRTREIGIRIALGARRTDVMRLVMREGVTLGVIGIVLGLGGAWALRRVVESELYGVAPHDPLAFVVAATVLLLMAVLASYIPSGRATKVDPARAVRED